MIPTLVGLLMSKGLPMLADYIVGKTEKEATDFIKEKTGIDISLDKGIDKLEKDTRALSKLSELDIEMQKLHNEEQAKKLDSELKLAQMSYDNISDARDTFLSVQESDEASWFSKAVPNILSLLITIAFVTLIYTLFTNQVPQENKDVFYMLIGGLGHLVNSVFGFHFGSSAGSKSKENTIDKTIHVSKEKQAVLDLF